jgi:hypothetical protein
MEYNILYKKNCALDEILTRCDIYQKTAQQFRQRLHVAIHP